MATKETTRTQKDRERITLNPAVLGGKPTIRGMRISVEQVLRALGNGITTDALLEDYPVLERQDIEACMLYAANLVEVVQAIFEEHADKLPGSFAVYQNGRLRIRRQP